MRDHEYTISVGSFNNKDYKGDDDFVEWMKHEAPLVSTSVSYTHLTLPTSDLV